MVASLLLGVILTVSRTLHNHNILWSSWLIFGGLQTPVDLFMINDILDLSKIEAGRMEWQQSDFDLGSLIQGLESMFKIGCEEKDLRLTIEWEGFDTDSDTDNRAKLLAVPAHGDEGKLRQVLINLMGNAVKFTDFGEVTLRGSTPSSPSPIDRQGSSRSNEAVSSVHSAPPPDLDSSREDQSLVTSSPTNRYHFEICDTGMGIDEAARVVLFEPFRQEAGAITKGGTGLGLAISIHQVELMGGRIGVESEPGKGSRFFFEIPLVPAQNAIASTANIESREIRGLADGHSVKALVVDDIRQNREVLSQLLEGVGCHVIAVDSGLQTLESVRAEMPDVVFLDIRMPEIDGIEVAKRIFEEYGRGKTKLLAISASVLTREQRDYMETGFDAFLGKPFRIEEVCACLQKLLTVEFDYADDSKKVDE